MSDLIQIVISKKYQWGYFEDNKSDKRFRGELEGYKLYMMYGESDEEEILYIGSTTKHVSDRIKFNHRGFVSAIRDGWILLCLISILLLPNVTAQAGDFLYTSDQLVFEYKFMELDSRTQYSDVLKRNDILRFELSSSIKVYTQDEFEDKLALLSIYINGESANPDIVEIFIYRVYLPVNGVDNDLFEDSDKLRSYYDIEGDPVINGDEISFHMEEADGPGVITVDHKYNKDTGILISYYSDYVDENQTIILEHMISTEYSDSTESGSTDTETALFPFLPLIIGISIIIKFRKMRL